MFCKCMSNPQAKNGKQMCSSSLADLPPCLSPWQQCQMSQWAALTLAYRAIPCLYACRGHAGEESRGWLNGFDQDKDSHCGSSAPFQPLGNRQPSHIIIRSYASNTLSLGTNTHAPQQQHVPDTHRVHLCLRCVRPLVQSFSPPKLATSTARRKLA